MMTDFLTNFGIEERNESTAFEHFCNYCLFTQHRPDAYSADNFFIILFILVVEGI